VTLCIESSTPVVIGLGTDIVEIARIAKMIERHADSFINRIYTTDEIRYCQKRKHCNEAFAGRWAAKEAIMKVLGTGFVKGIGWLDIEILNEKSGQPFVNIRGGAGEYAEKIGIDEFLITISHCKAYATATAIGIRNEL